MSRRASLVAQVDSFVGSNRLLRDGAIAVSHGWDIMSEYEAQFPGKIRKNTEGNRQRAYPDEVSEKAEVEKETPKVAQKPALPAKKRLKKQSEEKKVIDKADTTPYSDVNDKLPKLSPDEQKIVAAISGETLVDDVIASTGLPVGKVLATLNPLYGLDKVSRFFAGIARKVASLGKSTTVYKPVLINGMPGYLSLERGDTL